MHARRTASLLAVLATLLLAGVVAPAPASAATRDVEITQDGPVPARLVVAAGDTVRFVNTDTFVHRVVSDSAGWAFDSRTIFPGQSYTYPKPLTQPGTYAYRGAGLDRFVGSVVVPAGASPRPAASSAAPRPSSAAPVVPVPAPSRSAAPPSAAPSAAPSGSATPAPVAVGGSGVVQGPPPLAGGSFGGFGSPATPLPDGPAPLVAPGEPLPADAAPEVAAPGAPPGQDPTATTALGDLPALGSPVEARRYGLPLALALVLLTGVVSLLVRLLLAEAPPGAREGGPATA